MQISCILIKVIILAYETVCQCFCCQRREEGMKVEDVIEKLRGIGCGAKGTSCPDQLSRALEAVVKKED